MRTGGGIACAGHWVVDEVKVLERYPEENSLTRILDEKVGGGGAAYNVIINLAKFDSNIPLVGLGMVGNDEKADYIIRDCSQFHNIDLSFLHRAEDLPTSNTVVLSSKETGTRTLLSRIGASRKFSPDHIKVDSLGVAILHLGYLTLLDEFDRRDPDFGRASARFLSRVRERGIRTSLDLVSMGRPDYAEIVIPALRHVDYLLVNDFEAEQVTGLSARSKGIPDQDLLKRSSDALFSFGVRECVVIHFPEGAYVKTREGREAVSSSLSIPSTQIAGSAGAGDSFCAAFLYGIYNNFGIIRALEFAICAGGMNLLHPTTTGAIGTCQEVWGMKRRFPLGDWNSE